VKSQIRDAGIARVNKFLGVDALLAIAGVGIILTGHWATPDDMIADLIAGLLMVVFGVVVLLMWSFQR
jgi:hypothetical protein